MTHPLEEFRPRKIRKLSDYCDMLRNLLPPGLLWNNIGPTFKALLEGIAVEFNRHDQRNVDMVTELIPGLSEELLPDWENAVLTPDELAFGGGTLLERQLRVHTKIFNTKGPPTKKFFENLALSRNIGINISFPIGSFRVGVSRVGQRIAGATSPFIWIVDFVSGDKEEYKRLEPTFRRLKHAHKFLIFNPPPP